MAGYFNLKIFKNKCNGQFAFHPKKKELPEELLKKLRVKKNIKVWFD